MMEWWSHKIQISDLSLKSCQTQHPCIRFLILLLLIIPVIIFLILRQYSMLISNSTATLWYFLLSFRLFAEFGIFFTLLKVRLFCLPLLKFLVCITSFQLRVFLYRYIVFNYAGRLRIWRWWLCWWFRSTTGGLQSQGGVIKIAFYSCDYLLITHLFVLYWSKKRGSCALCMYVWCS